MKTVNIMDVPFLYTDQSNFVSLIDQHIQSKERTFVVTANPEIVMKAQEDPVFKQYIDKATYVTADGIGIVIGAKLLNNPLPERVTGYDTMIQLLEKANQNHYSIYLLGAQQETLDKTKANILKDYPNVKIVGSHNGFFDWDNNQIADEIGELKPDMTFVALGVPRQEKWIAENIDRFSHGIFMGIGGSFDVIAGTVKRAPVVWQKLNLEWLYRLAKQPSRWRRMMALPHFGLKVLGMKLTGKGKPS
ncbi:N-acetylglucosaminyldiphosphoundecaprenol N-acetyl-beta-D-mannosaminyltransferase [Gracilibacillus ureilyticus]|uniref:N-acetylglucosaminyldiphosphoundecaprenol N-acetyl-beta-D-mannosaminyltransferase n=1 Tax=Gracilibacillus ureilyticus TaxID=531814 RepID=A0A1H9RE58_9BACI|nr:WecB/TagA/CpsF family glycosyltransferase [Gracilibacillus ureilyticus]SER70243.1 N-acetylglucosaminyldiphosphoundecaprenol N-acetyl-beta-D-mannosaminyltransferase [Gracilibacillus ureilyticus]